MDIDIPDPFLRRLCEDRKYAVKKLGARCARKLWARLADLLAADNVTDLVAGKPHPLVGDRKGQYAVWLDGGMRLVFAPNHNPLPCHENGGVNWAKVTKVRIVFIGDYHD